MMSSCISAAFLQLIVEDWNENDDEEEETIDEDASIEREILISSLELEFDMVIVE
jgi:hypothetical protein